MNYLSMSRSELLEERAALKSLYNAYCREGLALNLSRGKPSGEQLALSEEMLSVLASADDCREDGVDCRNYGECYGLAGAKRFFEEMTGVSASRMIVCGNSSLNIMYDTLARCMIYGTVGSLRPWGREEKLKFLCPAPGYDRHFAITESLGFELITIPMTEAGPDMGIVEEAVKDPAVKGIWCVPKYSNPTGVIYSEETVRRLASMKTAAPDFRIFWDNAYALHDFSEEAPLADIFALAREAGNEERVFYFCSTSKVTYPGAGIAMIAAGPENIRMIKEVMKVQTIGHDKLNQLRHIRLFPNREAILSHMKKHGEILQRKFDLLFCGLKAGLGDSGIATWTEPKGGYFSSLTVLDGCAKEVYNLCQTVGVILTAAGATFPYGKDPRDNNLRLAPTFGKDEEICKAAEVLSCAVRLASVEKLLKSV